MVEVFRFVVISCFLSVFVSNSCSSYLARGDRKGDNEFSIADETPVSREAYEFEEEDPYDSVFAFCAEAVDSVEPLKEGAIFCGAESDGSKANVSSQTSAPSRRIKRGGMRKAFLVTRANYYVSNHGRGTVFDWYSRIDVERIRSYVRFKDEESAGNLSSFYVERLSERVPLGFALGDMSLNFGGGLLVSVPYFDYPFSSGFPFFKEEGVFHHTALYGNLVRGASLFCRGGVFSFFAVKGRRRFFDYQGFPNNAERLDAASIMFGTGRLKFGSFVTRAFSDESRGICSFDAEFEEENLHVAVECVSDGSGSPAYCIKGLGKGEQKSIAFNIASSPANYFTPYGRILGRAISMNRLQRGMELVLKRSFGTGRELALNFERYLSGNGNKDYQSSVFAGQFTFNDGVFSPLLRFSFGRRYNRTTVPFAGLHEKESPESNLRLHGSLAYMNGVMSDSRITCDYCHDGASSGVSASLWVKMSLFSRRFGVDLFILDAISFHGRPVFYYYAPSPSGVFPWHSMYGEGYTIDLAARVDAGRLRFSTFFIRERRSMDTLIMQLRVKL